MYSTTRNTAHPSAFGTDGWKRYVSSRRFTSAVSAKAPIPPPIRRLSKLSKKHYAYGTTFWEKEPTAEADTSAPNDIPVDLEALLPDPDNAIREETVTSVASARAWLQANLDYVIPAGMKKDDIKIEAAKRNVLFIQW